MAANVAEVIIKAVDQATGPLKQIGGEANNMGASFTKAGAAMAVAGGVIVGALGMALNSTRQYADELAKASTRTGIAAESLAGFKLAAEQGDSSLQAVVASVRKMSYALTEARSGSSQYVEALAALGIATEDLDAMSQEEVFYKIADAMKGAANDSAKLASAQIVLGRGAQELLPMFSNGAAGLREYQKTAAALGLTISTKTSQAFEKFNDELEQAKLGFEGMKMTVISALLPTLQVAVDKMLEFSKSMNQFAKEHPAAFKAMTGFVGALGAFLAVVGPVIIVLGQLKIAMSALSLTGGVAGAFAKLGAIWQSLVAVVTAVGTAIGASAGFVVAAIAAIIAAVFILGKWIHFAITEWDLFKLEVKFFGEELWALITGPFVQLWDNIAYMSQLGKNLILALWEGMKSVLSGFWNWLDSALVGPLREVGAQMMNWSGGTVGGGMANWRLPGSQGAGAGAQVQVYVDGKKSVDRQITGLSKVMVGG